MTRFRLTIEYDGRPFMGWQRQAHGPSVQQAIEEAVQAITHEEVTLHAAGRTDAGVHALAMTAHVDIARPITGYLNSIAGYAWTGVLHGCPASARLQLHSLAIDTNPSRLSGHPHHRHQ